MTPFSLPKRKAAHGKQKRDPGDDSPAGKENQEAKKSLIGWDARTEMRLQPNWPTKAVIQNVELWEQAVHHH